jgi:hypothetical protein
MPILSFPFFLFFFSFVLLSVSFGYSFSLSSEDVQRSLMANNCVSKTGFLAAGIREMVQPEPQEYVKFFLFHILFLLEFVLFLLFIYLS